MRKLYTFILSFIMVGQIFAGGIVTNSNQSADYVRMLSRNASGRLDAIYYNPAGLLNLDDGFHLAFHNQSIFQTKTITSTYPEMNQNEFIGDVSAPFFPNFYAAYKKNKIAISIGFGPNGGGGSATFSDGLPQFEQMVASIPLSLDANSIPTDAYSADIFFEGSSVYYGTQLNVSFAINDMISIAAGGRLINAKNIYTGHLKNIMINPTAAFSPGYDGTMTLASPFFDNLSTYLGGVSTQAYGGAAQMQPLADNALSAGLTFEQAEGAGAITAVERALLEGGLIAMGSTQDQVDAMTMAVAQGTYTAYGDGFAASSVDASNNSAATEDIEVDATQSGTGFTPILSANISLFDKLDIAVKYEFNTSLELKNDTKIDGSGLFPHDSTTNADIPAILAIGVKYDITDAFTAHVSYNTYFDKQANWDGKEDLVDNNLWELAIGLEYKVIDKLTLSAGYSMGQTGVSDDYQSDLSYSNSSSTIGFGGEFKATEKLTLTLGGMITVYSDYEVSYMDADFGEYSKTFAKSTSGFALGLGYRF